MASFEDKIGHKFNNKLLLFQAICDPHVGRSLFKSAKDKEQLGRTRIQAVGQSALKTAVIELIQERNPRLTMAQLSSITQRMMDKETLGEIGQSKFNLTQYLMSNGWSQTSKSQPLGFAITAIAGAIYHDAGSHAVKQFAHRLLSEQINSLWLTGTRRIDTLVKRKDAIASMSPNSKVFRQPNSGDLLFSGQIPKKAGEIFRTLEVVAAKYGSRGVMYVHSRENKSTGSGEGSKVSIVKVVIRDRPDLNSMASANNLRQAKLKAAKQLLGRIARQTR